jgi:hypothetical protein
MVDHRHGLLLERSASIVMGPVGSAGSFPDFRKHAELSGENIPRE